jgi:outer membrane protein assembly factor BamB
MPPSRRRLLRASGLSLSALAGCLTASDPSTTEDAATETTAESPSTTQRTETTDSTETPPAFPCGSGPLPDAGWPLPERSAGRTNYAPDADGPTEEPSLDWTATVPDPDPGDAVFSEPVVADGRVYVSHAIVVGTMVERPDEQYVHAYDVETGDELWRAPVSGHPSAPSVVGDAVVVHDDRTVYALDAASGDELWTYDPPGRADTVVPVADGLLVASTRADTDETVLTLVRDGDPGWRVSTPYWIDTGVAWADGTAYFVGTQATLVAVDTDDESLAWSRDLKTGDDPVVASVAATPCAAFATVDGTVHAARPDGEVEWSEYHGLDDLAVADDALYGVTDLGYVREVSQADGTQRWEAFHGLEKDDHTVGFADTIAVDDGAVYAARNDGQLLAVATEDGSLRWRVDQDPEHARLALADGAVYATWMRRLRAYR